MARASFNSGYQNRFIEKAIKKSCLSIKQIADLYSVHERTLRDWRREKYIADYDIILKISSDFKVSLPKIKKLDSYWYVLKGASIGGKKRIQMYGPPGTLYGRRLGGKISQERRRNDPEKYRKLGCNVRKEFSQPPHSEKLAELFGIIMGDGSISNYQVRITLDRKKDRKYAFFVSSLIEEILREKPTWSERENVIDLTLSGAGLVEILEKLGLQRGNKVKNQIKFPSWISRKEKYSRACTRGLFDTDGGFYIHKKQKKSYLGWCFANSAKPVLNGVRDTLLGLSLHAKNVGGNKLYLYSLDNIKFYLKKIGTHNPKNLERLRKVEFQN